MTLMVNLICEVSKSFDVTFYVSIVRFKLYLTQREICGQSKWETKSGFIFRVGLLCDWAIKFASERFVVNKPVGGITVTMSIF